MKEETEIQEENRQPASEKQDTGVSAGRRSAIAKLAYASPVIAGILFSHKTTAASPPPIFRPPPPPI